MKSRFFAVACSLALVAGCASKQVKPTEDLALKPAPTEPTPVAREAAPVPQATPEVMQHILLKLKRIHFSFDSVDLKPDTREALLSAADQLRNYTDIQLFIEGHADDRGTTEYNLSLGERRAQTVIDFLSHAGVNKERLFSLSKGEESPLVEGSGQEAWAKNRRVEYRIKQGDIQFELSEGSLFDDKGNPIPMPGETAAPDAPQEESE